MNIIFKVREYLKNYCNLINSVVIIALVIILAIQATQLNNYKSSYKEEVKSGSAMQTELDSIRKQNKELKAQVSNKEQLINDKDTKINKLKKDKQKLKKEKQKLEKTVASFTVTKPVTFKADGNYSQSTYVWNYLRGLGLNEYVCAGIMGNVMAEVGGQTLDISRWEYYSANSSTYYGICQWAGGRKQRLLNDFGTTLEDQVRFLSVELFEVIPKNSSFYNMQDEKEAALYFAKYYERCGSSSYGVRQTNATKALSYFTK